MITGYIAPGIWCVFFILGYFLPFYPHNSLKTQNFKKMKKSLEILWFYTSVPKIIIICYTVLEIWCATDRRTDKWKKWHIEVGAPPEKRLSCGNRNYFPYSSFFAPNLCSTQGCECKNHWWNVSLLLKKNHEATFLKKYFDLQTAQVQDWEVQHLKCSSDMVFDIQHSNAPYCLSSHSS